MSENKPTGCNIAAKALNRAGVKSDDGKPWTEEKLETIWRGIPPSVLKFLRLLNENGMPPEHAMSLISTIIESGGDPAVSFELWYEVFKSDPRGKIESWCRRT
jgi:hypothetical protein